MEYAGVSEPDSDTKVRREVAGPIMEDAGVVEPGRGRSWRMLVSLSRMRNRDAVFDTLVSLMEILMTAYLFIYRGACYL